MVGMRKCARFVGFYWFGSQPWDKRVRSLNAD